MQAYYNYQRLLHPKTFMLWIAASSKMFISILSIHLLKFKLSAQQHPKKFLNYILDFLISFYFDHGLDCRYLENPNILGYMYCWNISKQVILFEAKIKETFKVKKLQIYKKYLRSNRRHDAWCYLGRPKFPNSYNRKHTKCKCKRKMRTLKTIKSHVTGKIPTIFN